MRAVYCEPFAGKNLWGFSGSLIYAALSFTPAEASMSCMLTP